MIEKLPFTEIHSGGEDMVDRVEFRPVSSYEMQHKINELVDAVNDLKTKVEIVEECIHPTAKTEPDGDDAIQEVIHADPYAEQRQWIGKLCKCWDSDINDDIWGILQDIKDNKTEKYYLYGIGYEHCEPISPDDDIIYKKD